MWATEIKPQLARDGAELGLCIRGFKVKPNSFDVKADVKDYCCTGKHINRWHRLPRFVAGDHLTGDTNLVRKFDLC
jgi:hypothetical protein